MGRVMAGEEIIKYPGSGRVNSFSNLAGRVMSVKRRSNSRGPGRVKSTLR